MVGFPLPTHPDPVQAAQATMHTPGATVQSTLRSLQPPPLSQIPFVDDPTSTPGQWAQCISMVQDIWDAELFVSTSPDSRSGLLVENAAASQSSAASLAERLPVYLVSPPGQSNWLRAPAGQHPTVVAAPSREKRPRDHADADMSDVNIEPQHGNSTSVHPVTSATASASANDSVSVSASQEKRLRPSTMPTSAKSTSDLGLNLPVTGQHGASAVVAKLYDHSMGRDLKINTIVHAVGILQDPLSLTPEASADAAFAEEFEARNPSNVKRLHVVSLTEPCEWQLNPAIAPLGAVGLSTAREELHQVLPAVRNLLLRYLSSVLFGDSLAAEYLLLCLLSRPAQWTPAGAALGKLSLNLIVPNDAAEACPDFMQAIVDALANVCPRVVSVDLSIAALNARTLYPRKDYSLNRLRAAPLQIASGSVLLADETRLSDGRLAARGVKNVRAITKVAQSCMAPIDFQYYEAEVPVRCCTVIVSRGGKSIIPTDVAIKVQPDGSLKLQPWAEYDEDLVKKLRMAIALLAEEGNFDIREDASLAVEEEYVKARRCGRAKDGQETLQGWLSVARCCARSFGEAVLGAERWRYAWALEEKRAGRV